jgi:hypothetical protein
MPEPINYALLKTLLDTYGQTEFLRTYGTLDDIHQIQRGFIMAMCELYDSNITDKNKKRAGNVKLKCE